jgi:hypothetical protein
VASHARGAKHFLTSTYGAYINACSHEVPSYWRVSLLYTRVPRDPPEQGMCNY